MGEGATGDAGGAGRKSWAGVLSSVRHGWRKVSFLVPWLLAVIFTVVIGMVTAHHEMWRDEIQAWLLARDSSTPWALLHNMRYEGHPGLWHLILWPVAKFTWNPEAMKLVHVLIAGASALLVLRYSPFPFLIRIVIICGYFFAYEWAVISRNYAISVLLLFGICSLFKQRWRFFPYVAGLFFLLSHTNIHSIIITIGLTVFLMIEYAVAYAAHARDAHRYLRRVALGLVIIVVGLATGIKQTAPPEDSGFAETWYYHWNQERVRTTASWVLRADLAVPPDRALFWGENRFLARPHSDAGEADVVIVKEKWTRYGIALLLCLAIPLFKRPWPGIAYICISFALLSFFYIKYPGAIRHHGFLYLSLVVALWMSYYYTPWRVNVRWIESALSAVDRYRIYLFLPVFVLQVWGAVIAVKHDWSETFSVAKQAAEWLKKEYPEANVIYAGNSGPSVSAAVGYLEVPSVYYLDSGRSGSYVIWDQARRRRRQWSAARDLKEMCEVAGKDAVLISTQRQGRRFAGMKSTEIAGFRGGVITSENCFIYLLERID